MSYSESTRELLDTLNPNLTFHEDTFRRERINDGIYFVFDVTSTYQPGEYFCCHYQNKQAITRWDWGKVSILLSNVGNYRTTLWISKQHFKCKYCGKTFLAEDSVSDHHCSITRRVKQAVLGLLSELISMSLIARMKHISLTTVTQILRSPRSKITPLSQPLSEVVCFDEFKSAKNVSGAMSFIMVGGKTHQLTDIVKSW